MDTRNMPEQLTDDDLTLLLGLVNAPAGGPSLFSLRVKLNALIAWGSPAAGVELGRAIRMAELEAEKTGDFSRVEELLREAESRGLHRRGLGRRSG